MALPTGLPSSLDHKHLGTALVALCAGEALAFFASVSHLVSMPSVIALPVRIVRIDGGFKILDSLSRSIAYVYAAEGSRLAAMPDMLSFEEAAEVARSIAQGLTRTGET